MTINTKDIFENFTEEAKDLSQNTDGSTRILLAIPDITIADSALIGYEDSVALFAARDVYYRAIDQLGSSNRNENSPMSVPYVMFALQGGASFVNLCHSSWGGTTIEEMTITRLHEAEGVTDASYTTTYKTNKIIMATEIITKKTWIGVVMAQVGKVSKEHQITDLTGAFSGTVASEKDFIGGELG